MPGVRTFIIALLRERNRESFTVDLIRRSLADKGEFRERRIRVALSRAVKAGEIARVSRGFYRHPSGLIAPGLPDPSLRVHALKLECRGYKALARSFRDMLQIVSTVWPSPTLHRHPKSHGVTTTGEWRLRLLTATIHDRADLIELWLQASSRPLDLMELSNYLASIETATRIPLELWFVKEADWNVDVPGKLSTFTSIGVGLSAAKLGNLMVSVYQKLLDLVRVELRSFPRDLGASDVNDYISRVWTALEDIYAKGSAERGS